MVSAAAGNDPGAASSTTRPPSTPTSSRACPSAETTVPLMTSRSSILAPLPTSYIVTQLGISLNNPVLQRPATGEANDVVEDIAHLLLPGSTSAAPDMRGQDHVVELGEGTVELQRLEREDVETGRRDRAIMQRRYESLFVDHWAAAGIDDRGGRFHQRQLPGADEAVGLRAVGNMQGNEVRGSQEVVERRGADTEHIFNRRRQWLALGIDDVHLEGAG